MLIPIEKLKRLRDFINSKFGIFIEDFKLDSIYKRKFEKLMEKHGYTSFENFYNDIIFRKNSKLHDDFLNSITVNETYFFREEYQFKTLINYVLLELHSRKPSNLPINILSAPCSTGEEVYSIAIYIMEEGKIINERDIMLLGIDIDKDAIEKAKTGLYSERSVHKIPPHILNKYFRKVGKYYQVIDTLRQAVNFRVVNVLDRYAMKKLGKFDVIFSRNMLIYFDDHNKRETISIFYNILNPGGYLFLGHAEKIPSEIKLFKQIKIGDIFVYRKDE